MKGKLNKFGLSLAVLFAVAFSSFSMADDMKKDATDSAAKIAAATKIKAYYNMKSPDDWQTTGSIEYNKTHNIFRGLIQVMEKGSKKTQVYIVPLNLSMKGIEKEDEVKQK